MCAYSTQYHKCHIYFTIIYVCHMFSYHQVQEARKNHDDEGAKQAIHEFDETIDK